MYTREILEMPGKFIKHGKPVFGTFSGSPEKIDIRGVYRPFAKLPIPTFLTNFRIKSDVVFTFQIGNYYGTVEFFDGKLFGFAEVVFWDKSSNQKYSYRSFMGPKRRYIPHKMREGFCASSKKSRYIRISWDRQKDKFSVIFNLQGDMFRPSVQGALLANYSDVFFSEITNCAPAYSTSRCSLSYNISVPVNGSISIGETKYSPAMQMQKADGMGNFWINRMYYNYMTEFETISGTGTIGKNKISFRISMKQSEFDADNYNDNVLFVDSEVTPLPSVVITHPMGVAGYENKWVIQDLENMIDLNFTPVDENLRSIQAFFVKAEYKTVFGTLEGVLKTKNGEDIKLDGFPCIGKIQMLRL